MLTAAVQTICHFTRCAMGQVWLPAGDVLVCSPTWFCSGYGFEKLHAASEEVTYEPGQGLPGLAWPGASRCCWRTSATWDVSTGPSPPSGPASGRPWPCR